MKNQVLYNASDFPLNLKLTVQPNTGIILEELLELIREHGKYVYLTNVPEQIDWKRILPKKGIQVSFDGKGEL